MPLNRRMLTTFEFGQILPVFHMDVIPGDKISISPELFSRMAPLAVPTYGSAAFKLLPIFVPYHQVYQYFDAWIAGKTSERGGGIGPVYFTGKDVLDLFNNALYSSIATGAAAYDFAYNSGGFINKKFTEKGRYLFKLFRCLGYHIPMGQTLATADELKYNALPLLAFLKAFNDYMILSSRYETTPLTATLESYRVGSQNSADGVKVNLVNLFTTVFPIENLRPLYENDYFTSAWQFPNQPAQDSTQWDLRNKVFSDILPSNDNIRATSVNTEAEFSESTSQPLMRMVTAFDAWIRRNNYTGSKYVQRLLTRYGIKTEDYSIYFAHILGDESVIPLQIGDVTSTSNTLDLNGSVDLGSALGDYAGKGIVSGGVRNCKFKADDFGMLFYFAWVAPKPLYADAVDKTCLKLSPFDYYQPEFDGVGPQPIAYQELGSFMHLHDDHLEPNGVFGFTERYNEYRNALDQITGDFALPGTKSNMRVWTFNREGLEDLVKDKCKPQTQEFNTLFAKGLST